VSTITNLMERYTSDPATIGPLPLFYPTSEALTEVREGLEGEAEVIERLAIVLLQNATPEAAPHAPVMEPATAWGLYYASISVHLIATDLLVNCQSIIDAVTDLMTFQADIGRA
jgi:hypothetical protein